MSRVFVTQVPSFRSRSGWTPKHDLAPAGAFGELVVMMPPGNVQVSGVALERARQRFDRHLRDFDQEADYLLLLGDPVLTALAAVVLAQGGVHRLTVLKWDRIQSAYIPIILRV